MAEVVEFGRERGVRMMVKHDRLLTTLIGLRFHTNGAEQVEIDGPGHAAIWCKG